MFLLCSFNDAVYVCAVSDIVHVYSSTIPLTACSFPCLVLQTFGLTRPELLSAGLGSEAVDRIYRCLYVYTIGFFDVMQASGQQGMMGSP